MVENVTDRNTNRLIQQKSPYLLQHAYNPVEWYPWEEEAFDKAMREDKPIFLSIGYSTCHWCHVMEKESFEDEQVAELLNKYFVAIKVDREERPDIDHIYMSVCQAMTGHGGWPLTIIMTPEKKPFFVATYLPKYSRQGLSGLIDLLPQVVRLWHQDRKSIMASSDKIAQWVQEQEYPKKGEQLNSSDLDRGFEYFSRSFDSTYGGFGSAPKFPTPHNLMFLMRYHTMTGNKKALEMVTKTLESMYRGGLYDHIGFGFARYSTDRKWLVPHFEKMLYDNALLAMAYLEAYQLTHQELFGRIGREVLTYVLRDMVSPEGGFYSAEDADSEGEEGKFYLWTAEEIQSVLGNEDGELFASLYDISPTGNFAGKSIPNLIHRGISEDERSKIEPLRMKLFACREKRVHPYRDDKILTSWNGLMIAALAMGAKILKDQSFYRAAQKSAEFILKHLRRPDGRLLARYRDGEALYPAYASDYTYLIWGLIELYQAGFEIKHLESALDLNRDLIRYFWDDQNGGLFLTGEDSEKLLARPKEDYDGALPSSNSVAALNFLRLARLTGDDSLEKLAADQLSTFAAVTREIPAAHSFFMMAAMFSLRPSREVVITGKRDEPDSKEMIDVINQHFLPETLVIFKDTENNDQIEAIIPFVKDMKMVTDRATAYVCSNYTCMEPVADVKGFENMLAP